MARKPAGTSPTGGKTREHPKDAPCRPDWRDPEQYRDLLDLDRPGWAWEWLRRNPDYQGERQIAGAPAKDLAKPRARSCLTLSGPGFEDRAHAWGLCFRRRFRLPRAAGAAALGFAT
jgi:hypothetical protein